MDAKARARAVRAWLLERWADFRAQSRFFQARAALVAGYVVLVALTLWLAPPSPIPWEVKVGRIPFGIAFKTFIEVKDVDAGDYEDLVAEVTGSFTDFDGTVKRGTWKKKIAEIQQGQKLQLWPEDFRDTSGRSPANTLVVEHFKITDDDGDVVLQFSGK